MSLSWKGIVLAGGSGSRLYPTTLGSSKQLLPIYNKPMIYYSLSVLMLSGMREILIITDPVSRDSYKSLLGDGRQFGIELEFATQLKPEGLAQAFDIGEDFIGNNNVAMILGDNFFYGQNFSHHLQNALNKKSGATIFGHYVSDPERFGIVEIDKDSNILSIEEKPSVPKSNYAITGLYFYDNEVIEISKSVKKSDRGEFEISDVNKVYHERQKLNLELLGRGFAWLDMGTYESQLKASQFVYMIEEQQGLMIACLEEIALKQGWLKIDDVVNNLGSNINSEYGNYILNISKEYDI